MLWLTDLHLDRCSPSSRKAFDAALAASSGTPLLITGDISNASRVVADLETIADLAGRPLYFVLGNHDHYGASIATLRDDIIALNERRPEIQWLPRAGVVALNEPWVLVGVDGWADGRYGDPLNTPLRLNDDRLIPEIAAQTSRLGKLTVKRVLADADAARLKVLLNQAGETGVRHVVVATHVPPFVDALRPGARIAHAHGHPLLVCGATGDVLREFAVANQELELLVLTGHSHAAHAVQILPNLRVLVGLPRQLTDMRIEMSE